MQQPYRTEVDVLNEQLLFGKCRVGRDAAREIARRVEAGHGFWDFDQRKRTSEGQNATDSTSVVDAEVHDGASRHFLAGRFSSGEETPTLAA